MLRRSNGSPRPRNYESLLTDDDDDFLLSIRPKKTCRKRTPIDRISMLTDSLLTHILSFLPIEDAIKTDVLSKRWQYLWTSLPSFLFSYPDIGEDFDYWERIADFVAFVDKTLVLCNCSKLKKFVVEFEYDSRFASNVNLWTRFAARNATEELQLQFYTAAEGLKEEDRFVLPQLLFTNSSFTELRFSLCSVIPKGVVCWKSLKKLSIGYVKLNDGVIGKILAGSPVLENLELYYFYGITRLHVVNASLKKLILREFWEEEVDMDEEEDEHYSVLEILAPNLTSLEILGCFGRTNCWLADVSSLVDATLNCDFTIDDDDLDDDDLDDDFEWHQNISRRLLQSLVHVKNLTLGTWLLQALSILERKGWRSPLSKCECLTLDTDIKESVLPGIANILESSSHLETLVITMSPSQNNIKYFFDVRPRLFNFNGEHYWTSQKKTFNCLMMHLKIVKCAGLRWYYRGFLFSFVQFLLKNARVLQKMVIKVDCLPHKELFQVAQKFLSFPRSSPNAVIMFN
ncbi:probable F-box protein At1g60180 [Camellia sinensis]|uniref:probable F-box protein At1g60180 n=1 Tax=Camellia sinensis TaxID=4442 RepID=UPI0010360346|nr:probable F-box protein At1g60180 [Camellia sinensis]